MSIRVGGVFVLKSDKSTIEDKVALSYRLLDLAIKHKIGLQQGGNAKFQMENHSEETNSLSIPFDLTDDPLDNNAECLFSGNNIKIYVNKYRIDNGETLLARMKRIQCFFKEILSDMPVEKIILNINVEIGDEYRVIEVDIKQISTVMLDLYKENSNWTPIIKLIINKG